MDSNTTTMKGVWWLADVPARRLQGEITYGPMHGAEVDIYGIFYDSFDDRKLTERVTIHGLTFNSKQVSLFQCHILGTEIHIPGGASCKVRSCSGIVGGHYRSLNEAAFTKVQVRFEGLMQWLNSSGIDVKYEENPRKLTATYQVPKPVALGGFEPFNLRIEYTGLIKPRFSSLQIEEDCLFVIEAEGMQPYPAFDEYIRKFQQFLCLATQCPVHSTRIIGQIDQPSQVVHDITVFEDYQIIQEISEGKVSVRNLIPQEMFFSLPELGKAAVSIFTQFIIVQGRLQPSMDLYFATIYDDTHIPGVKFLMLAQGLEAYHRITKPGKFTLKERLMDLSTRHVAILGSIVGDPFGFSSEVSRIRNKLTHPSDESAEIHKDFMTLIRYSERMALILEVSFLTEIGLNFEQTKAVIENRSKRARRICQGWI